MRRQRRKRRVRDARRKPCVDLLTDGGAIFGEDRKYRYFLTRFERGIPDGLRKPVCFVLLNPSTADEQYNDPTVQRCFNFAKRWGFNELMVVNIFALRSTDPKALKRDADPIGPINDSHIRSAISRSQLVVVAWGNHGTYLDRGRAVIELIREQGAHMRCFGITKAGQPVHPLYQRNDASLIAYGVAPVAD